MKSYTFHDKSYYISAPKSYPKGRAHVTATQCSRHIILIFIDHPKQPAPDRCCS